MSERQGFDDGADWLLAQLAGGGATGSAPQASPPQSQPQAPSAFAAPAAPASPFAAPASPPPAAPASAQPAAPVAPARASRHEEVLDWFSLAEPPARDDTATRALPVIGEPGRTPSMTPDASAAHPLPPQASAQPPQWSDAGFATGAGSASASAGAASAVGAAAGALPGATAPGATPLPPAASGLPAWTPPFTVAPPAPTVRLTEVEPPVGGAPAAPAPAPVAPVVDASPMPPAEPAAAAWQYQQASPPAPTTPAAPVEPTVPVAPPGPVTPAASFALTWGDQELESEAALRAAFQQLSDSSASIGLPAGETAPAAAPQSPVAETAAPDPALAEPAAGDAPFSGFSAPAVARSSFTPVGGIPIQEPHPTAPPEAPAGWGEAPAPRTASYDDELWAALNEPEPAPAQPTAFTPAAPVTSEPAQPAAFAPSASVMPEPPAAAPAFSADSASVADVEPATPSWTPGRAWTDFATARPEATAGFGPTAEPDPSPATPAAPAASFEYREPAPSAAFAAGADVETAQAPVEAEETVGFPALQPESPEPLAAAEPVARRSSRFDAFAEELEWTPRAERRPVVEPAVDVQAFHGRDAEASDPATAALPVQRDHEAEGVLAAPRAPFPAFAAAAPRPEPSPFGSVPPVDDLLAALGGGAVAPEPAAASAAFTGASAGVEAPAVSTETDGLDRLGLVFDDHGDDHGDAADDRDEEPVRRAPFWNERRVAQTEPADADDEYADDESDDASDEVGYLWNLRPDPTAEDPRAESPGSVSAILAGGAPASRATAAVDDEPMSSGLGSLVRFAPAAAEPEPAPDLAADSAETTSDDRFFDAFAPRTAEFEPQFDAEPVAEDSGTEPFGTDPFGADPFGTDRFGVDPDPWSAEPVLGDQPFGAAPESDDQADDGLAALFGSVTATGPLRLVDPSAGRPAEAYPATALLQTGATAQLFAAAGTGAGVGGAAGTGAGGFAAGSGANGGFPGGGQGPGGRGPSGPGNGSGRGPSGPGNGSGRGSSGNGNGGDKGGIRPLIWIAGGLVALLVLVGLFFLGTTFTKGSAADAPSGSPSASASETPPPAPTAPQPVGVHAWDTLFGGECLEPFTDAWQEEYTVVDCATPHAAQLVYRGTLPGDAAAPYPGEAELATQMNLLCTAAGVIDVAAASGMDDLQVQASYPAEAAQWEAGARDYYCFANRSGGEPLTASIAGPGPAA
ncbi:septum formation family protein [Agromyces sp. NPDC058104]|uniref:septum formation family protein n=1 Tax=Agromyces sp. NPDC058104 TaxID=3346342 RepID=UPI0036DB2F08